MNTELFSMGPEITLGGLGGLLHDGSHVAGDLEILSLRQKSGLDIENLSAGLGPREACHYARGQHLALLLDKKGRRPEIAGKIGSGDGTSGPLRFHHFERDLARDAPDRPFELPDAGLTGVLTDKNAYLAVCHAESVLLQAGLPDLPREQEALRDLNLFLLGVSGQA